jgi:hypothetical protein
MPISREQWTAEQVCSQHILRERDVRRAMQHLTLTPCSVRQAAARLRQWLALRVPPSAGTAHSRLHASAPGPWGRRPSMARPMWRPFGARRSIRSKTPAGGDGESIRQVARPSALAGQAAWRQACLGLSKQLVRHLQSRHETSQGLCVLHCCCPPKCTQAVACAACTKVCSADMTAAVTSAPVDELVNRSLLTGSCRPGHHAHAYSVRNKRAQNTTTTQGSHHSCFPPRPAPSGRPARFSVSAQARSQAQTACSRQH